MPVTPIVLETIIDDLATAKRVVRVLAFRRAILAYHPFIDVALTARRLLARVTRRVVAGHRWTLHVWSSR